MKTIMILTLVSGTCFGTCFPSGNGIEGQMDYMNCLQLERQQRKMDYTQQQMLQEMREQSNIQRQQLDLQEQLIKKSPYAR